MFSQNQWIRTVEYLGLSAKCELFVTSTWHWGVSFGSRVATRWTYQRELRVEDLRMVDDLDGLVQYDWRCERASVRNDEMSVCSTKLCAREAQQKKMTREPSLYKLRTGSVTCRSSAVVFGAAVKQGTRATR